MKIEHQCRQRTLRRAVSISGVGLHTGQNVTLTLRPGKPDAGVVFLRKDATAGTRIIRGNWRHVEYTQLATKLTNGEGLSALTVEHLMAALRACEVDNVVVELDSPEVPILDGSSKLLIALIDSAGQVAQAASRRFIRVLRPVEVREGDKWVRLEPGSGCTFDVEIDFPSAVIGRQRIALSLEGDSFRRELAAARTFGFMRDFDHLRQMGLVRGGSMDNAIVVDGDRVANPEGLRFPDEFVRHKLLDSIGDLYLAGAPILGHYRAFKPGHAMNAALVTQLLSAPDAHEWVSEAETVTTLRRHVG